MSKILILDDDETSRTGTVQALANRNILSDVVTNYTDPLPQAKYELLLVIASGLEKPGVRDVITHLLKEKKRFQGTMPIVVILGYVSLNGMRELFVEGVTDVAEYRYNYPLIAQTVYRVLYET